MSYWNGSPEPKPISGKAIPDVGEESILEGEVVAFSREDAIAQAVDMARKQIRAQAEADGLTVVNEEGMRIELSDGTTIVMELAGLDILGPGS